MIDRLLFAFIFLSLVSPAYGDYFDGFKCHQELPASQDMKLDKIPAVHERLRREGIAAYKEGSIN